MPKERLANTMSIVRAWSSAAPLRRACSLAAILFIQHLSAQTSDLVAHYPLNGDAQDASGNGLHGTTTGTTATADRFGNSNGALFFSNDTDRVDCGNPAAFNFAGPFSISAWVKVDGTRENPYIVSKYDFDFNTFTSSPHSYGLGLAGISAPYGFVGGDAGYVDTIGFGGPLSVGAWYAVAMTYDGNVLTLYRNGNPISGAFAGPLPPFVNSVPLTIGGTSLGQVFGGAIDDVRIYSRSLSGAELLAQYTADLPPVPPSGDSLVAHYALNADAKDKSGNGFHGTLVGTTPIPDRFGKKDRALRFNGSSDYVDCGNRAEFNFSGNFTLSAWVQMDGVQFYQYVIAKYNISPAFSYGLGINGNADAYGFIGHEGGYQDLAGGFSMGDGEWHAISLVYEAGVSLRLYMDGEIVAGTAVGLLPPFANSTPLTIGRTSAGAGFVGGIDDVRIYRKALSNEQIAQQFEADTPQLHIRSLRQSLVASYALDGHGRDTSRNNLDATIVGTTPTADRFGRQNKALYFDGNLDRLVCGNDAAFNFTNAFTVSAWVKLDGAQVNNYIVAKYDFDFGTMTGEPNAYGIGLNGSIDPYCFVGGDVGYGDLRGLVSLNDDAWHFLSMTYESGLLRLFLDGILINQRNTGILPPFVNSVPLTIGGTVSGQGFRGAIDSVRLYNRALFDSEMAALYLK